LLTNIIVATDDKRIADVCNQYDCPCIMTSVDLQSGTERVYEAYKKLNVNILNVKDVIINIQGDEPLLMHTDIDRLIENFMKTESDVGTLITQMKNSEDIFDTSNVKVVIDKNDCAMYFSRSPIPYIRDVDKNDWHQKVF
jgi:3-deoxy-manno-octulosonate cytidylyltransferase (CMP-KDO synthetase)